MSITISAAGWAAQAVQQALSHETAHAPDAVLPHEATHAPDAVLQHEATHAEEMSPLKIQRTMKQDSNQMEAISNTLRKAAETSDAIIRNMR